MNTKERPIIFNEEMVRAILDGRKTQTRRVMKHQPGKLSPAGRPLFFQEGSTGRRIRPICHYGQPGDRLWVREAFSVAPRTAYAQSDGVQQTLKPDCDHDAAVYRADWERSYPSRWRPSIHMPRWASRITLEITGVRVERLNDISEADAIAEGVWTNSEDARSAATRGIKLNHIGAFVSLWESIYGNRPKLPNNTKSARYRRVKRWLDNNPAQNWDVNPWVWVIEFRRITDHQ